MFRKETVFKIHTQPGSHKALYIQLDESMAYIEVFPTRSKYKDKLIATPKIVSDYVTSQGWKRYNDIWRKEVPKDFAS